VRHSREAIAATLAPAVGQERALELVVEALRVMGIHSHELTGYETRALLDHLSHQPGIVGVSARLAHARFSRMRTSERPSISDEPTMPATEIAALLAPSIGEERARELVEAAVRKLGYKADALDREQATRVFDELAKATGVVGAVARFAKARALLQFR